MFYYEGFITFIFKYHKILFIYLIYLFILKIIHNNNYNDCNHDIKVIILSFWYFYTLHIFYINIK